MRPVALLPSLLVLACLHANTDLSETGATAITEASTTSSTGEQTSTTSTQTLTTEPEPCDDDPACGPGEDVETCPEQCSVCGDGQASGTEACDNGADNQTYWPQMPPDGACSEQCTSSLQWCGDGQPNGAEPCDNGTNSDAP